MGLMDGPDEASAAGGRLLLPATFQNRWFDLWSVFSDCDGSATLREVCAAYNQAHRCYHNITHLVDCLTLMESYEVLAERPQEVEFALWFHDAVYRPTSNDNEQRSAEWAQQVLRTVEADEAVVQRIYHMIMATKDHLADTPDGQLVCGIDLAILGTTPELFERYEHRVRQEYVWVPGFIFRHNRKRFIKGMLERKAIFQTKMLHHRFEAQARQNLERSLQEI